MSGFYDAKNDADLARVEAVLQKGGIEYTIAGWQSDDVAGKEIKVAEEDFSKAEELLLQAVKK